ncbi:GHMP kinase, partial [Streptomyces sp. NPDC006324]
MTPTSRPTTTRPTPVHPRTGAGSAPCHHGELLQGVFLDAAGRRCAGLVTLPLDGPGSAAVFVPRPGTPPEAVAVVPALRPARRRPAAEAQARADRHRH